MIDYYICEKCDSSVEYNTDDLQDHNEYGLCLVCSKTCDYCWLCDNWIENNLMNLHRTSCKQGLPPEFHY